MTSNRKMTSFVSSKAYIPSNKLYINVSPIQSTIVDLCLNPVPWVCDVPAVSTIGAVVLRDMGKTVYLPDSSSASTILRKVQLIPPPGITIPDGGQSCDYFTGYIRIGAQGGGGLPTGVARLN
jgi:hypothetical protein